MYNKPRVIPVLSIIGNDLVKTTQFKNPRYLGDPVNAVKIFNGKGVDELIISDIRATKDCTPINFALLTDIASQAFMPMGYGGGIETIEDAKKIFRLGFEKIIFSTNLNLKPHLIQACIKLAGSSSVVASIDFNKTKNGYAIYSHSGTKKITEDFSTYIKYVLSLGVGEMIFTSIDHEGSMNGYDFSLLHGLSFKVEVPLIINGGAGKVEDLKAGIKEGFDAVAGSSMFVFYGTKKTVLINYKEVL
jgi:imidazole glycerol-phosphate synthase subunit HisF